MPITMQENDGACEVTAGYTDWRHVTHCRRIALDDRRLTVVDSVTGFTARAVLRWRLAPGAWRLDGLRLSGERHELTFSSDSPIVRVELIEGWESRLYLQKTAVPVLELEIGEPGTITSEYRWRK